MNTHTDLAGTAGLVPATIEITLPDIIDAKQFFGSKDAVEEMISKVENTVRAHVPDLSTRKGRDAVKSLAYSVSRSKTFLDGEGKKLVEGIKAQAAVVDASRKLIRDRLDTLRDAARRPLDEWEAAESERKDRDERIMRSLADHGLTGHETAAEIVTRAGEIKCINLPDDFGVDRDAAEAARSATMRSLHNMFTAAREREAATAELAKLRAEAEARAAKEAEEQATREEEQRIAERQRAEAEHAARQERERAEAAEKARQDAEARAAAAIEQAQREAAERIAKAEAEADAAIERERQAQAERDAQAERERQEAEERTKREAEEKAAAEADGKVRLEQAEQRRERVQVDIEAALQAMAGRATPRAIAEALMAGKIPHCIVEI